MAQPNILILITDQQTHAAMSCAGNEWLSTPAMDALAQRGTRFQRAYCTYPLCTPARASHMTGRYPHELEIYGNTGKIFWGHDFQNDQQMAGHFARAGYRCVWAGKDTPPADGSRLFEVLCSHGDVKVGDRMTEFLRDPGEKPFLALANFVNPHNICEWAREMPLWEGQFGQPPVESELPLLPANHAIPPYEPEILRVVQKAGMEIYLPRNYTPLQWRRYLWAYYRMVELVDRQIGRITRVLEENGLAQNTLVIFMSDHGDGCAAHRWNQKMTFYEEVIRVPMILAGPGVEAGRSCDGLVSTGLDLLPTCLAAAGVSIPADLPGRSILDLCSGSKPSHWREELIVESALNPESGNPARSLKRNVGRCIVTDRYKYSVWKWGHNRQQLVDLEADPGEMVNLAAANRSDDVLEDLRSRLADWCRQTDDAFQVPGHEIFSPGAPRD
ncbi:MAG: sulfatase [Phycisphaerae bacterium]